MSLNKGMEKKKENHPKNISLHPRKNSSREKKRNFHI